MLSNKAVMALGTVAHNDWLFFLLVVIVFDFLTGYGKAIYWKVADSTLGIKGIVKHATTFFLYVGISFVCEFLQSPQLGQVFMFFILLNYVISILENVGVMGVKVPSFLQSSIKKELERYNEKRGEE